MQNIHIEKRNLIKSPLNYTGGKYKLLPQILPLLPDNIDIFVDLFGGGFNVGINVKADKIIYNDIVSQVVNLLNTFKTNGVDEIFNEILNNIKKYNLSNSTTKTYEDYKCLSSDGLGKYNKDGYLNMRESYNNYKENNFKKDLLFYTLICYSFNNQIRFNSKGNFNMPYGKRDFNKNIRNNLNDFLNKLHKIKVDFYNKDFRELEATSKLTSNDFVYADPPYLITTASYNENGGWTKKDEYDLLNLLDNLNKQNIKFALSNVFEHKGKSNDILKEWSKKYNVNYINSTYFNCNYQSKDKNKNSSVEVLITNYVNYP